MADESLEEAEDRRAYNRRTREKIIEGVRRIDESGVGTYADLARRERVYRPGPQADEAVARGTVSNYKRQSDEQEPATGLLYTAPVVRAPDPLSKQAKEADDLARFNKSGDYHVSGEAYPKHVKKRVMDDLAEYYRALKAGEKRKTKTQIAEENRVNRDTLRIWEKRAAEQYGEGSLAVPAPRARGGAWHNTPIDVQEKIVTLAVGHPNQPVSALHAMLGKKLGSKTPCTQTIRKVIEDSGAVHIRADLTDPKSLNTAQKRRELQDFREAQKEWGRDRKHLISVDETNFYLNETKTHGWGSAANPPHIPRTKGKTAYIAVYAAAGLIPLPEALKQKLKTDEKEREALKRKLHRELLMTRHGTFEHNLFMADGTLNEAAETTLVAWWRLPPIREARPLTRRFDPGAEIKTVVMPRDLGLSAEPDSRDEAELMEAVIAAKPKYQPSKQQTLSKPKLLKIGDALVLGSGARWIGVDPEDPFDEPAQGIGAEVGSGWYTGKVGETKYTFRTDGLRRVPPARARAYAAALRDALVQDAVPEAVIHHARLFLRGNGVEDRLVREDPLDEMDGEALEEVAPASVLAERVGAFLAAKYALPDGTGLPRRLGVARSFLGGRLEPAKGSMVDYFNFLADLACYISIVYGDAAKKAWLTMDNAPTHAPAQLDRSEKSVLHPVVENMGLGGAIFIPVMTPDLAPIEFVFSFTKGLVRVAATRAEYTEKELAAQIDAAFLKVTARHLLQFQRFGCYSVPHDEHLAAAVNSNEKLKKLTAEPGEKVFAPTSYCKWRRHAEPDERGAGEQLQRSQEFYRKELGKLKLGEALLQKARAVAENEPGAMDELAKQLSAEVGARARGLLDPKQSRKALDALYESDSPEAKLVRLAWGEAQCGAERGLHCEAARVREGGGGREMTELADALAILAASARELQQRAVALGTAVAGEGWKLATEGSEADDAKDAVLDTLGQGYVQKVYLLSVEEFVQKTSRWTAKEMLDMAVVAEGVAEHMLERHAALLRRARRLLKDYDPVRAAQLRDSARGEPDRCAPRSECDFRPGKVWAVSGRAPKGGVELAPKSTFFRPDAAADSKHMEKKLKDLRDALRSAARDGGKVRLPGGARDYGLQLSSRHYIRVGDEFFSPVPTLDDKGLPLSRPADAARCVDSRGRTILEYDSKKGEWMRRRRWTPHQLETADLVNVGTGRDVENAICVTKGNQVIKSFRKGKWTLHSTAYHEEEAGRVVRRQYVDGATPLFNVHIDRLIARAPVISAERRRALAGKPDEEKGQRWPGYPGNGAEVPTRPRPLLVPAEAVWRGQVGGRAVYLVEFDEYRLHRANKDKDYQADVNKVLDELFPKESKLKNKTASDPTRRVRNFKVTRKDELDITVTTAESNVELTVKPHSNRRSLHSAASRRVQASYWSSRVLTEALGADPRSSEKLLADKLTVEHGKWCVPPHNPRSKDELRQMLGSADDFEYFVTHFEKQRKRTGRKPVGWRRYLLIPIAEPADPEVKFAPLLDEELLAAVQNISLNETKEDGKPKKIEVSTLGEILKQNGGLFQTAEREWRLQPPKNVEIKPQEQESKVIAMVRYDDRWWRTVKRQTAEVDMRTLDGVVYGEVRGGAAVLRNVADKYPLCTPANCNKLWDLLPECGKIRLVAGRAGKLWMVRASFNRTPTNALAWLQNLAATMFDCKPDDLARAYKKAVDDKAYQNAYEAALRQYKPEVAKDSAVQDEEKIKALLQNKDSAVQIQDNDRRGALAMLHSFALAFERRDLFTRKELVRMQDKGRNFKISADLIGYDRVAEVHKPLPSTESFPLYYNKTVIWDTKTCKSEAKKLDASPVFLEGDVARGAPGKKVMLFHGSGETWHPVAHPSSWKSKRDTEYECEVDRVLFAQALRKGTGRVREFFEKVFQMKVEVDPLYDVLLFQQQNNTVGVRSLVQHAKINLDRHLDKYTDVFSNPALDNSKKMIKVGNVVSFFPSKNTYSLQDGKFILTCEYGDHKSTRPVDDDLAKWLRRRRLVHNVAGGTLSSSSFCFDFSGPLAQLVLKP